MYNHQIKLPRITHSSEQYKYNRIHIARRMLISHANKTSLKANTFHRETLARPKEGLHSRFICIKPSSLMIPMITLNLFSSTLCFPLPCIIITLSNSPQSPLWLLYLTILESLIRFTALVLSLKITFHLQQHLLQMLA